MYPHKNEWNPFKRAKFSIESSEILEAYEKGLKEVGFNFPSQDDIFINVVEYMKTSIACKYSHHFEGYIVLSIWQEKFTKFCNLLGIEFNSYLERDLPKVTSVENVVESYETENSNISKQWISASAFMKVSIESGSLDLEQGFITLGSLQNFTSEYVDVLVDSLYKYIFRNVILPWAKLDKPINEWELSQSMENYVQNSKYGFFKTIKTNQSLDGQVMSDLKELQRIHEQLFKVNSNEDVNTLFNEFYQKEHAKIVEEYFPEFLEKHGIELTKSENNEAIFSIKEETIVEEKVDFSNLELFEPKDYPYSSDEKYGTLV